LKRSSAAEQKFLYVFVKTKLNCIFVMLRTQQNFWYALPAFYSNMFVNCSCSSFSPSLSLSLNFSPSLSATCQPLVG